VTLGLRRLASAELMPLSRHFYWTRMGGLGSAIRRLRRNGVRQVVMAGKVYKAAFFGRWGILQVLPDLRALRFWYNRLRRDNKDDTLLLGLIAEFERDGLRFGSVLDYCPELLVRHGLLTRRGPTTAEE